MSDQEQLLQTIKQLEEQIQQLKQSVDANVPDQPVAPQTSPPPAAAPATTAPTSDNQIKDTPKPPEEQKKPEPAKPEVPPQPKPLQQSSQDQAESPATSQDPDESKEKAASENIVVGKEGTFDGVFMISDDEKKYQVPPNYISKSMLVIGDRLKIMDMDETGSRYSFKQLEHIERREVTGILTKKDNQWAVHTNEGTFYVVAAAVKYYGGDIGDKAVVLLPAHEVKFPVEWGALKELFKPDGTKATPSPTPATATTTPVITPPASTGNIVPNQPAASVPPVPPTPTAAPVPAVTPPASQTNVVQPSPPLTTSPTVTEGEVHVQPHDEQETSGEVDLTLSEEQRWELR
jgi:hypothetical protein